MKKQLLTCFCILGLFVSTSASENSIKDPVGTAASSGASFSVGIGDVIIGSFIVTAIVLAIIQANDDDTSTHSHS
jgi:hypothetical protein